MKKFRSLNHVEMITNLYLSKSYSVNSSSMRINLSALKWKFEWDNRSIRRFGVCKAGKRKIGLNKKICEANLNNAQVIVNVILHEIAHALQWEASGRAGHNHEWVEIAQSIGCDGKQYYDSKMVNPAKTKYSLKCPVCGQIAPISRIPKRSKSCGSCCRTYNPKYKLKLIQNY